jgi:serine/threonine protein kinase
VSAAKNRYQFVHKLAAGGTSEVFLARDTISGGRPVAIKRLFGHFAGKSDLVARFRHEAFVLAHLRHPGIPALYEARCEAEQPWLVMDYVPGVDFGRMMSSGRIPRECALAATFALLGALAHAHSCCDTQGRSLRVVHRDVTPSNLLIANTGTVTLIDFGLATSTALTEESPGTLRGTPGYLAPEAITSEAPVDLRADLFAAGVMLYEATVGARLFTGNVVQVMNATAEARVPRLTAIRSDYPPALESVVLRALARRPEDRYSSAEEMAAELADAARRAGWSASPESLGRLARATSVPQGATND